MDVELQSFVGFSPSMSNDKEELGICYCLFIQSFMTIIHRAEQNRPNLQYMSWFIYFSNK